MRIINWMMDFLFLSKPNRYDVGTVLRKKNDEDWCVDSIRITHIGENKNYGYEHVLIDSECMASVASTLAMNASYLHMTFKVKE